MSSVDERCGDVNGGDESAVAIDRICDVFEGEWKQGSRPLLEEYLIRVPASMRGELLVELLRVEGYWRRRLGEEFELAEYVGRFGEGVVEVLRGADVVMSEYSGGALQGWRDWGLIEGRYELRRELGRGAFGVVYLALEVPLARLVAIKFPVLGAGVRHGEWERIVVGEGRAAGRATHPHLVQVYYSGFTELCGVERRVPFVVFQYVEGRTLAEVLLGGGMGHERAALIAACICEALQAVHERGLVHRDVKPANVLIEDETWRPYLTDFGLCVQSESAFEAGVVAGSPCYMSPEQAAGEGHRVNGSSDQYSVGLVLFEMLTGERGIGSLAELVSGGVVNWEERMCAVPGGLGRICVKMLSRERSQRFASCGVAAEALRGWLSELGTGGVEREIAGLVGEAGEGHAMAESVVADLRPRGLGHFISEDAEGYLGLISGRVGLSGLPESLEFWKSALESRVAGTYGAGMLYGPSGCGKSSFLRAGIIPNLSSEVLVVLVECRGCGTEELIVRQLQRLGLISLSGSWDVGRALAEVRAGAGVARKVLLVLDQFEQWLHGNVRGSGADLVRGLRHCDGVNLQMLLVVREEFWVMTGRFGGWLDVVFHEGRNAMMLDLFPVEHARRVLERFGRSLGRLVNPLSADDEEFLVGATGMLERGGLISPIELSLLVEAMRERPWRAAELASLGGIRGAGLELLERHLKGVGSGFDGVRLRSAAEAVLGVLLPEGGMEIRGLRRSRGELLCACSGVTSAEEGAVLFAWLMELLTGRLRWVSLSVPVDNAGGVGGVNEGEPCYELAHDYLVALLREWLSRSLRGSESGRARLLLEERASEWSRAGCPDRLLLTPGEFVWIRRRVVRGSWTGLQRSMMERVWGRLRRRLVILVSVLCVTWFGVWGLVGVVEAELRKREASRMMEGVCGARLENLGEWVERLGPYGEEFEELADTAVGLEKAGRLNVALVLRGLERAGNEDIKYLVEGLLDLGLEELLSLERVGLLRNREMVDWWRERAMDAGVSRGVRLRAACLWLASMQGESVEFPEDLLEFLVAEVGGLGPGELIAVRRLLAGAGAQLAGVLLRAFEESAGDSQRRGNLAVLLSEYGSEDVGLLGSALLLADVRSDRELTAAFARHGEAGVAWMRSALEVVPWRERVSTGLITGVLLSDLEGVCEELRSAGRRPERIRPEVRSFVDGRGVDLGEMRVNVVWVSDVDPWEIRVDCGEVELRGESGDWRRGGLCLREAVMLGEGADGGRRYVAVWGGECKGNCCCLAGLTEVEFEAAAEDLCGVRGYRELVSLSVSVDRGGVFRYTGVFRELGVKTDWNLRWNGVERHDWPQRDVSGVIGSGGEFRRVGVWVQEPLLESRLVSGVGVHEVAERIEEGAASGWQVSGVVAGETGEADIGEGGLGVLVMQRRVVVESQLQWEAERRAAAAIKLLELGTDEDLRRVLVATGERRVGSEVLSRLIGYGVSVGVLDGLWRESGLAGDGVGSGVDSVGLMGREFSILAVGEFAGMLRGTVAARVWLERLLPIYAGSPDPGLHSAAGWSLRELGYGVEMEEAQRGLSTGRAEGGRRWYLERIGEPGEAISLAILRGPQEFLMGSPLWEWERAGGVDGVNELRHMRRIPRSFAIGMTEVTVAQYRAFRADYGRAAGEGLIDEQPASSLTWYECAAYCNWLSERAGISRDQWCYDPGASFEDGMPMLADSLERTGYRLPTDAEWEYACRAGAATSRYWGGDSDLLGRYARVAGEGESEGLLGVGSLRPNGFGLFDMQGNVGEWCDGQIRSVGDVFGGIQVDLSQGGHVRSDEAWGRVVRGGNFYSWASAVRSAERMSERADRTAVWLGFRVARTIK